MRNIGYAFIILVLVNLSACKMFNSPVNNNLPIKNLIKIVNHPDQYKNRVFTFEGYFMGWSGSNCFMIKNFANQITRSDWTFKDMHGNCIFVTGGKPAKLESYNQKDILSKIIFNAKVRLTNKNNIYLEYSEN